ncbi:hypothetical protein HYPSUDRAFT_64662 [Hypholoma sublateritium FD-334 SS-4]|uniref:Uncharacterized protein n=1 Tax=Hypholoma sublateritium (strain FD-334 SS-4) TaxID=945553 RepID=A0A0D2MND8_HYPSF|nr:hypothetical protein HYPSUDRAFT_64662 [Hypholoma sublateritium FD-334 SS-4]
MSTIISRLRQIQRILSASRRLPWVEVPKPGPRTTVLYQRSPPWWAKWAHAIIAVDVMLMTSIVEYTWDFGGFFRQARDDETSEKEPAETESLPLKIIGNIQEKSAAKKVFFSGFYVLSGVIFGAGILASRSRILRKVTAYKAGPRGETTLYLQTAAHPRNIGHPFPSYACSLKNGDMPSRLLVVVQGHGGWTMLVNGANVPNQNPKIGENPRHAVIRAWRDGGGWIEPSANAK